MNEPVNTFALNQSRSFKDLESPVWVFGYGSLIYKVDFPYRTQKPAYIRNWCRRFWQGSHDHRGTPEAPGRVVTLIEQPNARCDGLAYLVEPEVFNHLDYREKNGYLRVEVKIHFHDQQQADGLMYVADETNPAFLGYASELEIACHIASAAGPSGSNRDYLLHLAQALRKLNADDAHVFAIEQHLLSM